MDDNMELISSGESQDLGESGTKLLLKMNGTINNNGTVIVVSPSVTVETSSSTSSLVPAVSNSNNKRQGLRKWKRIPRELAMKTTNFNNNNKENGDWNVSRRNVSPVHEMVLNGNGDGDSDLSSRSSTAASPPRSRIGSGKKARAFNMQKEESLNSAVVFVQGSNSLASRSRQSEPSAKYDEESSDDKDLNEEAQVAFVKSDVESDDALVESIKGLHFAQEEFEKEVMKWRDVGKDDPLNTNDPLREILELKDTKILELELALSCEGFKAEIEDSLMKMIQADVENVVITATTRRLIEGLLCEIKHRLQEKSMLSEDVQTKKQDDKLETKESVKKLQSRVCRFTLFFVIQFILLFVTLYLKSSTQIVEVVPT